jgi:hypothetical protein
MSISTDDGATLLNVRSHGTMCRFKNILKLKNENNIEIEIESFCTNFFITTGGIITIERFLYCLLITSYYRLLLLRKARPPYMQF